MRGGAPEWMTRNALTRSDGVRGEETREAQRATFDGLNAHAPGRCGPPVTPRWLD